MNKNIIIIGGGISGITTALSLQLLGFETTIYAQHLVDEQTPLDPKFASLYPAASVIPHSIQFKNLRTLFPASLAIFELLHNQRLASIEIQRHYEVFEFPVEFPEYTQYLHNVSSIDNIDQAYVPHRADTSKIHGWVFDCFITHWPDYIQQLYQIYQQAGGEIHQKEVRKDQVSDLPTDYIINCTGVWSNRLFSDEKESQLIRGHLLHLPDQEPVSASTGHSLSYNYTPDPSVYATPDGSPSDVYFYPINGNWILGGSRQPGTLSQKDGWEGQEHEDTVVIDGLNVPRQIIELNKELLNRSYGKSFDGIPSSIKARVGYRFTREAANDGLRVEPEEVDNKMVIHNYGHGGAGVTLSWGCALNVLQLLAEHKPVTTLSDITTDSNLLKNLQLHLHQVYLNYFES